MSATDVTPTSVETKKRFDIAILFAVCGILFSLLIFLFMFKQERDVAIQGFNVKTAQDSALFQQQLTQNLYSLDSLQAYFYSVDSANAENFSVAAKRIASRNKAINSVIWLPNAMDVNQGAAITVSLGKEDILKTEPQLQSALNEIANSVSSPSSSLSVLVDQKPYAFVSSKDGLSPEGRLVVLIDLESIIQSSLLNTLVSEIAIDLSVDSNTTLFSIEKNDLANDAIVFHEIDLLPDTALKLQFIATEAYLSEKMSYTSALFLLTGLLLSFLMASYLRRIGQHLNSLKSEQAELTERITETSCNDPLTGLVNRLHFDEALEIECGRAVRDFSPLTMILIRIDDFKPYSERYGIEAADDLLRQVSGALKSCVGRPGDMIANLDHNLFGFILPSTNELVVQLANRCCSTVRELDLPNESLKSEGKVAISVGVATLQPSSLLTAERLFEVANDQLQTAINEGGDRYVAFAENSVEPSVTYSV
jgi:diguanylate cyclase (GGDEF)-like protein